MRVEYAHRAVSDLRDIATYYASSDHPGVGAKLAICIQDLVERISHRPESGRPLRQRPGIRVASLLQYRYNIFYLYQPADKTVRILHIRHTSRQPWR